MRPRPFWPCPTDNSSHPKCEIKKKGNPSPFFSVFFCLLYLGRGKVTSFLCHLSVVGSGRGACFAFMSLWYHFRCQDVSCWPTSFHSCLLCRIPFSSFPFGDILVFNSYRIFKLIILLYFIVISLILIKVVAGKEFRSFFNFVSAYSFASFALCGFSFGYWAERQLLLEFRIGDMPKIQKALVLSLSGMSPCSHLQKGSIYL